MSLIFIQILIGIHPTKDLGVGLELLNIDTLNSRCLFIALHLINKVTHRKTFLLFFSLSPFTIFISLAISESFSFVLDHFFDILEVLKGFLGKVKVLFNVEGS